MRWFQCKERFHQHDRVLQTWKGIWLTGQENDTEGKNPVTCDFLHTDQLLYSLNTFGEVKQDYLYRKKPVLFSKPLLNILGQFLFILQYPCISVRPFMPVTKSIIFYRLKGCDTRKYSCHTMVLRNPISMTHNSFKFVRGIPISLITYWLNPLGISYGLVNVVAYMYVTDQRPLILTNTIS